MKAVVLLSGGLDSATTLYYVIEKKYKPFCLTFDYGQRNIREIYSARKIAELSGSNWRLLKICLPWKGSSLLDRHIEIRAVRSRQGSIPNTYVPARNIIFLSYAASYAETIGAHKIFIGANQIDYSGYPDCRQNFLKTFEDSIFKGTKSGCAGRGIRIAAPFIKKSKAYIIKEADRMRVPLEFTRSCYRGTKYPCNYCDSCFIRAEGFKKAGIKDPLQRFTIRG